MLPLNVPLPVLVSVKLSSAVEPTAVEGKLRVDGVTWQPAVSPVGRTVRNPSPS